MATDNRNTSTNKPVPKKATTTKTAAKKKTVARKKTSAKRQPPPQSATASKKVVAKKTRQASKESITDAVREVYTREQRHKMIANMAYFLAEKRGFAPGNSDEDWLQSEKIIDDLLKKQGIKLSD